MDEKVEEQIKNGEIFFHKESTHWKFTSENFSRLTNFTRCKQTFFFLVVPLTKAERELRRQHGHDALMSQFQAGEKELFF